MSKSHVDRVATELALNPHHVTAVAALLEDGATVPFISRYRKERTGSLDEVAITAIRDRMNGAGATAAHLTGSGSTVIAVFARRETAAACARALTADPPPGTLPADVRLLAPLASLGAVEYYG